MKINNKLLTNYRLTKGLVGLLQKEKKKILFHNMDTVCILCRITCRLIAKY